jgi:hypothetical protein
MVSTPKIDLSQLRQIGWSEWDPISLQEIDPDWRSDGGADEYDSYLLHVAGLIRNGRSEADAVEYLVGIETKHMDMDLSATTHSRAIATVRAIRAYLETLQPGD